MGGYEFDTTNLRFSYSSMTTPSEVYDYDMASRTRILRKRQEIPSGHNPADYVTTRIMATSHDGAQVPVSILHRKDLKRDGTAPLLLYGYGSYGMAMPASFSANRLSLVDRGFVYAIAHIRGGSDKGWGWYLDGKREKKTNSFDDFAARGRALIDAKYTGAKRIVGHGGSAGGMLMGAVANRAGELFAGIVAEVPFVDVLNTMLDDTLPLTPPEWPEWGNPIESEADFRTILSYSPYDNVAAQDYPAILAMGGLTDPRVTYWEPAKWIARLRATMTRAARCCCAPTWAPATAAPRAASTASTKSRSPMRSRCGRWDWRSGARCRCSWLSPRLRGEGWGEGRSDNGLARSPHPTSLARFDSPQAGRGETPQTASSRHAEIHQDRLPRLPTSAALSSRDRSCWSVPRTRMRPTS